VIYIYMHMLLIEVNMITTLDLPEDLLNEAMKVTHSDTKPR